MMNTHTGAATSIITLLSLFNTKKSELNSTTKKDHNNSNRSNNNSKSSICKACRPVQMERRRYAEEVNVHIEQKWSLFKMLESINTNHNHRNCCLINIYANLWTCRTTTTTTSRKKHRPNYEINAVIGRSHMSSTRNVYGVRIFVVWIFFFLCHSFWQAHFFFSLETFTAQCIAICEHLWKPSKSKHHTAFMGCG